MERIAEYVSKMNIPKLKDIKIYFMGCKTVDFGTQESKRWKQPGGVL